jgi:hypothetical protein
MAGKLKLEVEHLQVESFDVQAQPVGRGTVHAHFSDAPGVCITEDPSCNAIPSCNGTCNMSCGDTCGYTCGGGGSCGMTCGDTCFTCYTCELSCGGRCTGDWTRDHDETWPV